MMALGQVQFAITIPPDFTRRVIRRDKPQILVEADASDPVATGGAVSALAQLPSYALAHDLTGPLAQPAGAAPFQVIVHQRYNPESISAYNIVPGLLGVVLSMTLVMMTALGVTREVERGTMESLLATPVKPLEVIEDSRCPSNVTCVWAGRLRLRAEVSGVAHELTLGEPLQTSNGTVTLAVVSPGAWSQWPGGKPPYRFGFRKS